MDSDTKEFGHVRVAERRTLGIPRIESDHTFLETVLPIENLLLARVLIRVRNRPLQERHRTGRSREQKTLGFDVRFGSKADVTLLNFDVRFTPESGHRREARFVTAVARIFPTKPSSFFSSHARPRLFAHLRRWLMTWVARLTKFVPLGLLATTSALYASRRSSLIPS
jgi:hypothetical protein